MPVIPDDWLPAASMQRIIVHWTAGGHKANKTDKRHYHLLIQGDGTVVRGPSIACNQRPLERGYAAHTRHCNSGSIGVALCCMSGAVERPFNPGRAPMTRAQWDRLIQVVAALARHYRIPVMPQTVLSHAEVQGTLGIEQRGKWDVTRLAFDPSIVSANACGNKLRTEVSAFMSGARPEPAPLGWRLIVKALTAFLAKAQAVVKTAMRNDKANTKS